MVTRALIEFIRDERAGGASHDAIRAKLKEKGWKDEDVNEGIQKAEGKEVPLPPQSFWEGFLDLLSLSWGLYRAKWKRFVGVGLIYLVVVVLASVFLAALLYPAFVASVGFDGKVSMEAFVEAGGGALAFAVILYALIQIWFISAVYATALKTGTSSWERARAGLLHLPAVLGIKLMVGVLLVLCFIPPLLVAFFTQNPLVLVVFAPFSFIGAALLGLCVSLSIPAYFHGVAWTDAIRTSISKVWNNFLAVFINYLLLVVGIVLVSVLFQGTGPLAALAATMVIAPIQALFMLALYRTLHEPERPVVSAPSKKSAKKA